MSERPAFSVILPAAERCQTYKTEAAKFSEELNGTAGAVSVTERSGLIVACSSPRIIA